MPIDCNPGQGREGEDPSIYLRVQRNFAYEWYVIKADSKTPQADEKLLTPVLPKSPKHLWYSGCGVIGSTIYVVGGEDNDNSLNDDVYYIDTRRPSGGWKKGCSMKKPRSHPYSLTVDRKLYVLGSTFDPANLHDEPPYAEAFDERESRWTELPADMDPLPSLICGHAVLDNPKRFLFHSQGFPSLYYYHIDSDSWGVFSESTLDFGGKNTSALVDGILYCLDYRHPGFMFGLDVSNPGNKLQKVLGFDKDIKEKKPLPQPDSPHSNTGPRGFLVPMGNSKLAVLWAGMLPRRVHRLRALEPDKEEAKLLVSYSILNMYKQPNATTGGVDFVAETLSVSYYNVLGSKLNNCLPV
ncbi:hypothetical protein Vadar_026636 [Vaccinium darrowii]|uniref:Uncharacterized protein n=1 Tax=Vaccinium darrowii TaxID=229202 RepID=A0ACB7YAP4_9ERIC|nr:hypothetical protein Vadar_026636 [Vaccinium darrowii]